MTPSEYFRNKRVVITGGSSGIGLAMARRLVGVGASVSLLARKREALDDAMRTLVLASPGAGVVIRSLDVSDADATARTIGELVVDGVDILVNSAGITLPGRFVELPPLTFRTQMEVNYFGTVNACRAVLPHFLERKAGHIVNVGSLGGLIGIYGYSAYAPSKFAVTGFSQALRAELRPHGIFVSVAHPPDTDTPMLANETPLRPAETRAIAGTAPAMTADVVAAKILAGSAAGQFDIFCDGTSRAMAFAQGVAPWSVRWVCDSAQRKAGALLLPQGE
jgi:3-dehydrosphinganine reductase